VLSKEELIELKSMLENRKAQIIKNIQDAQCEIADLHNIELNDEADFASASSDDFTDQAIAKQQKTELEEINYALDKMKDTSYGICEMCEEEVGIARLKVKPFAKFCIACREIYEKNPKK
jgi:DnaK suppressor protein